MKFTFDPAKDAANQAKRKIEWETLWAMPDARQDYGEERWIGYAYSGLRLYCVVFTDRGLERRIISLRKANGREIKHYAEA